MNKPLRIWHLISNRWYSAISEYAFRAALSLRSAGHNCLFSPLQGKPLAIKSQETSLKVIPFTTFSPTPKAMAFFLRQYKLFQPDVVITYGGPETVFARFLTSTVVVRFRGKNEDFFLRNSSRFDQFRLGAILTPSPSLKKYLLPKFEIPVDYVNLGLDTGVFCYQKGLISSVKRPTIRIVGRLDPVKGHEKFFHYFRNLLKIWDASLPLPFLEIIGEPANLSVEHLLSKANSLGLIQGEHFQIIGTRLKDLPERLAQTHVGVICSEGSEVICRVAEEFLLCGTPVFVSGVGSLEDCIYSSDAGVSYKKLNTDDTVQKLKGLLLTSFHESQADKERRSIESAGLYSKDAMGRNLSNYIEKYCVS